MDESTQRKEGAVSSRAKVLLARFALDGHDRGVVSLIGRCRDAGMEAVYIHYGDPREVAKAAQEEDVDVIGLTSSMGEHFHIASGVLQALKDIELDTLLIVGGVIPTIDEPKLLEMGVRGVFGPGSALDGAVALISELASKRASSG